MMIPTAKPSKADLSLPQSTTDADLLAQWQEIANSTLQRLREALGSDKDTKAKGYSIAAAVATDKVLLLSGRPPAPVTYIHEHRHELVGLAERLAKVAGQLGNDDKGMSTDTSPTTTSSL